MKPIYTRYETRNLLEDLGEDVVHFIIYFKTEELPEVRLGVFLAYRKLLHFIEETNYPIYEYLNKIRSSMTGYGPKETKVLAKIEQEGFDLEPFLKSYLESKDEVYFARHLESNNDYDAAKHQEKAKNILKEVDGELGESYASRNIKWHKYVDELDQTIHELTFRYYPEIFEKGEKKIKDYKDALITATLSFSGRVDKILNLD